MDAPPAETATEEEPFVVRRPIFLITLATMACAACYSLLRIMEWQAFKKSPPGRLEFGLNRSGSSGESWEDLVIGLEAGFLFAILLGSITIFFLTRKYPKPLRSVAITGIILSILALASFAFTKLGSYGNFDRADAMSQAPYVIPYMSFFLTIYLLVAWFTLRKQMPSMKSGGLIPAMCMLCLAAGSIFKVVFFVGVYVKRRFSRGRAVDLAEWSIPLTYAMFALFGLLALVVAWQVLAMLRANLESKRPA